MVHDTPAQDDEAELAQAWADLALATKLYRVETKSDPVEEWRIRHGPFRGAAVGHVCTANCTLVSVCPDMFGCEETGATHLCGISDCKSAVLAATGFFVCALTGRELSVVRMHAWSGAIGADIETNGDTVAAIARVSFKPKRTPTARRRLASSNEVIRSVLSGLFWNPEYGNITRGMRKSANSRWRREAQQYIQDQRANGRLPSMCVVEDISQRQLMRSRLWQRQRCCEKRMDFYVATLAQLWKILSHAMQPNRTESHLRIFAIGAIYMIQHGLAVNQIRILPVDDWLVHNIPLACDVAAYGYEKKFITRGRNTILDAFKTLVETRTLKREDLDIAKGSMQAVVVGGG